LDPIPLLQAAVPPNAKSPSEKLRLLLDVMSAPPVCCPI
jgi:hypothetical protein